MSDEYLQHYGVPGMRWGVRRASKQLSSATTKADRDLAASKLKNHKAKGSAEISKLKQKNVKLKTKYDMKIPMQEEKAAKIMQKSARIESKAYRPLTTRRRSEKLQFKAKKLDAKAKGLMGQAQEVKSKIEKNEKMIQAFNQEISKIDKILVENGKRYVNG